MTAIWGSRTARRLTGTSLPSLIVFVAMGCHHLPVAPAPVVPVTPGTVRILGAVALPQVTPIPPQGLTLGGAIELAGGIVTEQQAQAVAPPTQTEPDYDVQLTPPPQDVPENPRNTLYIYSQRGSLFFEAYDVAGKRFLNRNEARLKAMSGYELPVAFKSQILDLIGRNQGLTPEQKRDIVDRMKDIGEQIRVPRSDWGSPAPRGPSAAPRSALDPDGFLIGLRRVVAGVPNTTFFAVPLVLKYQAGAIPLLDGDQVRVVHSSATILQREGRVPSAANQPAQITSFVGTLANATVLPLSPNEVGKPYQKIRDSFAGSIDVNDFGTMNSLTRVNPTDNGVETFILPNHGDLNVFPLYDTRLIKDRTVQDGDVFGMTTLPQVPAIAVPALTAARDSLIDVLQASRQPAPARSRFRRSLATLGRGQVPPVAPLPTLATVPPLPRSLDLPPHGAIADRLRQHKLNKHGVVDPVVVPTATPVTPAVVPDVPVVR